MDILLRNRLKFNLKEAQSWCRRVGQPWISFKILGLIGVARGLGVQNPNDVQNTMPFIGFIAGAFGAGEVV